MCVDVYVGEEGRECGWACVCAQAEGDVFLSQCYKLLSSLFLLSVHLILSVHCACMSSNTQYVLSPSPALSLPANVPSLSLLPLIHLFRTADCLLPESVLPTGPGRDGGGVWGVGEPCGTCAVYLFQMGDTHFALKSSTCGWVHIIWPGIIQRAERATGCKLKGSLWLIAALLLINTVPLFQASRLAEHQN